MKARILSEEYQLSYKVNGADQNEPVEYKEAYWQAFALAGALRTRVDIQRVATVEIPEEAKNDYSWQMTLGEGATVARVITGLVTIDREHFSRDVELSRFHSVNGWVIPDYVEDFEYALLL